MILLEVWRNRVIRDLVIASSLSVMPKCREVFVREQKLKVQRM